MYGIDSAYDYDPVWAEVPRPRHRARVPLRLDRLAEPALDLELHVQPRRHARRGPPRAGQVAVPRRRDPPVPRTQLRLPRRRRRVGGVAARRSHRALGEAQPRGVAPTSIPIGVDKAVFFELMARYGGDARPRRRHRCDLLPREDPRCSTSSRPAGSSAPKTSRELFVAPFFFGCEADDPMNTTAFNAKVNPFGARLQRDVRLRRRALGRPDMTDVLEEAWEMVDHGWIDDDRLPRLRLHQPGALLHRREPARSSPEPCVEPAVDDYLAGA